MNSMDYSGNQQKLSYQQFLLTLLKWVLIGIGLTTVSSIFMVMIVIPFIIDGIYLSLLILSSIIEVFMVYFLVKRLTQLSNQSAKKYYSFCINMCLFWFTLYNCKIFKNKFFNDGKSLSSSFTYVINWIYYFIIYECSNLLSYYCHS